MSLRFFSKRELNHAILTGLSGFVGVLLLVPSIVLGLDDPKVVPYEIAIKVDGNRNSLSDVLEKDFKKRIKESYRRPLAEKPAKEMAEVLVSFSHEPQLSDSELIRQYGGEVLKSFTIVHAALVRIPADQLWRLGRVHDVLLIEENATAHAFLKTSTRQIGARRVWNGSINNRSYFGSTSHALAILDTGIDDSHPDLEGRIIAWYDATVTSPSEPIDDDSHGTHVSGITAGSGVAGGTYDFSISYAASFPFYERTGYIHYYPVHVGPSSAAITARLKGEAVGGSYVLQIRTSNGGVIGESPEGPMPIEVTSSSISNVTNPAYQAIPYVMTEEGTGSAYFLQVDVPYDAWDSYPILSGIAPNANLVGVKVLYGGGSGTTATILDGLSWISDHAEEFNIVAVNSSLGFMSQLAVVDTAVNNLVDQGVVFVAAAGNAQGFSFIGSPATAAKAITVGAVSDQDALTNYSSLGNPDDPVIKPDVLAPGGSFVTDDLITACDSNDVDRVSYFFFSIPMEEAYLDDYTTIAGTSMSTPHVTGLVGLLAEALDRDWNFGSHEDPLFAKMILLMTAYEVGEGEEEVPSLERGGKDRSEGYGRIAADAAIEAVVLSHTIGTTEGGSLGEAQDEKKVWARKLSLSEDHPYGFLLNNPQNGDFDLYLYHATPDSNGEPQILKKATTASKGSYEKIQFTPSETQDAYLVAKWVSGSGNFQILSRDETTQPRVPVITSPTEGFLTNNVRPLIRGIADFEMEIELYDEFQSETVLLGSTTTNTAGEFQFTPSGNLSEGIHQLSAVAVSSLGIRSSSSASVQITIDITPPAPPVIETPTSGTQATDTTLEITGTAEEGSVVEIFIDEVLIDTIQTDPTGSFALTVEALEVGIHSLTAEAIDAIGNRSETSEVVTFTILGAEPESSTEPPSRNTIVLGGVFVNQPPGTTPSPPSESPRVPPSTGAPSQDRRIGSISPPPVQERLLPSPGPLAQREEQEPSLVKYEGEDISPPSPPSHPEGRIPPVSEGAPSSAQRPRKVSLPLPSTKAPQKSLTHREVLEAIPQKAGFGEEESLPPKERRIPILPIVGIGAGALLIAIFRTTLLQIIQRIFKTFRPNR